MTLQQQLAAISRLAHEQGRSDEFVSHVLIFYMVWNLSMPIHHHGLLDDDQVTNHVLEDEAQLAEFKRFIGDAGVISWYDQPVLSVA